MARRTLVVEVDEERVDAFVDALSHRSYLRIYELDRSERKQRKVCPCCGKRLSKEQVVRLDEDYLTDLLRVAEGMARAKSVILTNRSNPLSSLPPGEHERCITMSERFVARLADFGLIAKFMDGARETYHLTASAVLFLRDETSHSPAELAYLDGKLVESGGSVAMEDIVFKTVTKGQFLREAKDIVDRIPARFMSFVNTGQMPLV